MRLYELDGQTRLSDASSADDNKLILPEELESQTSHRQQQRNVNPADSRVARIFCSRALTLDAIMCWKTTARGAEGERFLKVLTGFLTGSQG